MIGSMFSSKCANIANILHGSSSMSDYFQETLDTIITVYNN